MTSPQDGHSHDGLDIDDDDQVLVHAHLQECQVGDTPLSPRHQHHLVLVSGSTGIITSSNSV